MNRDIVPGIDDSPENAHLRNWHDISLDHPMIELERVEELSRCLLIRLKGQLTFLSQGYFAERIRRIIKAGFSQLIFDCTELDRQDKHYWNHLLKAIDRPMWIALVRLIGLDEESTMNMKEMLHLLYAAETDPRVKLFEPSFSDAKKSIEGHLLRTTRRIGVKELPSSIRCPLCKLKVKATKIGLWRCPSCKQGIEIFSTSGVKQVVGADRREGS